ncbi:substrate-binding domain-containing protein [Butyrivibrio sp. X503]|uniref:substrate-binding domain-containing protein n=1 Tax=Butyrivibrio sp. X503 TaxID=2364878 RepID=UPI001314B908|nr:substrate-binding domain-containing protein [Butyrivibrio sp. X503]
MGKKPLGFIRNKLNKSNVILSLTILFVILVIVVGLVIFRFNILKYNVPTDDKVYDKYYVMITDNYKSDFWQEIYKGAFEAAKEQNIYVDLLGDNLPTQYSCEQLMKIAIASKVDGIMVYANESDKMTELINEAEDEGIPVVTLYSDNTHSNRLSFVGVGSYNIGREYGKQILNIIKDKDQKSENTDSEAGDDVTNIAVLVNSSSEETGQNILISAIKDAIEQGGEDGDKFSFNIITIIDTNAFSVEESIRDIFLNSNDDIPDVIVCLNELNTVCTYQAVVDFTKVGETYILGYYDSDAIIREIEKGTVYATVGIDSKQLGEYCITALSDYYEFGNTSQYYTADVKLINQNNVASYKKEKEAQQDE